jgi:hypothetical protein
VIVPRPGTPRRGIVEVVVVAFVGSGGSGSLLRCGAGFEWGAAGGDRGGTVGDRGGTG